MAVQGSQDVKIFSSVRPLQIQRSFEGPSEATDSVVGSITGDETVENPSGVTITSSLGMSNVNAAVEAALTPSFSASPATVIIKTASSTTFPDSPGTVTIRSSGAATVSAEAPRNTPGGGGQNVVIIRSPSAVAPTGPAAPHVVPVAAQSTFVIKTATSPPVAATVVQPNAQGKIVINPSPIAQSRITITGGASPLSTVPHQAPTADAETEVVRNETQAATQAPLQARRSSLTIKTAPSPTSPTPVTEAPSVHSHVEIQRQNAVVIGEPPSSQWTPSEQLPYGDSVTDHRTPYEPNRPPTDAPTTTREDLSEKIHLKKPAGPSLEEVLEKFDISKVFYIVLAVLVFAVTCILTEGEVPLSWILAAIAVVSLGSFIALRL